MNVLNYNSLNKRDALAQAGHDGVIYHLLRSLSHEKEPEFLGYTEKDHRLARREFGTHPLVPMFRFDHFKHGSMEITSRDTLNGTFITLAYAGQSTHLLGRRQLADMNKRQEDYDDETLTGGAVEARFDTQASQADPANLTADAGDIFNTFEPEISCILGDEGVHDASILDIQMYDKTNEATFGFGTIFLFSSSSFTDIT